MSVPRCPCCNQPMRLLRAGVYLPALKVEIFDAIAAAGDTGISADELRGLDAWRDKRKPPGLEGIKSHVNQINDYLGETDWSIRRIDRRYVLVRLAKRHGAQSSRDVSHETRGHR